MMYTVHLHLLQLSYTHVDYNITYYKHASVAWKLLEAKRNGGEREQMFALIALAMNDVVFIRGER